jgi:exonuclease III
MPIALRIATFNLENFDDLPTAPTLATRVELMQRELVRLRADVLCLQEVNSQDDDAGGRATSERSRPCWSVRSTRRTSGSRPVTRRATLSGSATR